MKTTRRRFLAQTLSAGLGASLASKLFAQDDSSISNNLTSNKPVSMALPELKDRSILFVKGGWEGHQPEECLQLLKPWMESEGAKVTVSENLNSYLDKELMAATDLIIQIYTMSEISKEQEEALAIAVRNGVGLAGWHGGLCDAFRQNVEYQFMTGGQWVAHPGGVIDYEVHISDKNDLVTSGLSDFKIHSEQYYMHVDPNVKVLATTTFSGEHADWIKGCTMPVTWKKMYGKGRVFYTSLGHVAADLEVPETQEMLRRGIRWASASKYEKAEKWISPVYPGV